MKKIFVLCAAALLFFACGKTVYKDGTYRGKSGVDDTGAWGEIALTLKDSKVTDCVFITRQKDGSIKDENYGKVNGEISSQDFYDKAQLAIRAMEQYRLQFLEKQSLKHLDAVSGATIAYNQFIEAAENALNEAGK
ncbi:FMN-binding protein [Treponema primitia]|uniref:FMN-binding protein n=1 Tax=Treponema primitia TaxID=88058 RepID=UPI00397FCA57